jgi:hypothetical protein
MFGQFSIVSIATRRSSYYCTSSSLVIASKKKTRSSLSSFLNGGVWNPSSTNIVTISSLPFPAATTDSRCYLSTRAASTSVVLSPPNPNPISFRSDPSPLSSLPDEFRPGQAQQVLQERGRGKRLIRRVDVRDLFLSAREGYPVDAKCILHTLKHIRRCNAHYIKDWQAQAAIQGMIRALTPIPRNEDEKSPAWKIDNCNLENPTYCKARLQAAMFVCKAILDDTTGLITSVSIYDIEEILLNGTVLPATKNLPTEDEDKDMVVLKQEALKLTKRVFHKLIFRACKPERFLSKKQAAKYRKKVWVNTPPSVQTTHLATQICLSLGGTWQDAQVAIVDAFLQHCDVPLLEETLSLIEEAKNKEEERQIQGANISDDIIDEEGNDGNSESEEGEQELSSSADKEITDDTIDEEGNDDHTGSEEGEKELPSLSDKDTATNNEDNGTTNQTTV